MNLGFIDPRKETITEKRIHFARYLAAITVEIRLRMSYWLMAVLHF